MRKNFFLLLVLSLTALMLFMAWGCANPDGGTEPTVPDPQGTDTTGDPTDPNITPPFSDERLQAPIADIAIEGDGDLVFATTGGLQLFTPYGTFKRTINPGQFFGLVSSSYSAAFHSGKGILAVGPDNGCNPTFYYDDEFVQEGVTPPRFAHYNESWWGGLPDPGNPPTNPVDWPSTSAYESCTQAPQGIAHHPFTNFTYQRVTTETCIGDPDFPWPDPPGVNEVPYLDVGGFSQGILAYDPTAPLPPTGMDGFWEGGVDFVVYYDAADYLTIQNFLLPMVAPIVPACATQNSPLIWDQLAQNGMSDTPGMGIRNVTDITFDALGRLILVVQGADGIAVTDPVNFPNPITVQKIQVGRQNGMGTLPGEFQGPQCAAIDPRNQNILIADSGNGRIQVFDNDLNFIREFGAAYTWVPGAMCVDAFGTIYVADRANGGLLIFDEYGQRVQYGTIEGWVYDKDTHLPIDNAGVFIMSTFNPLGTILTDANGYFSFPAVASGTHNIVVEKYGYNSSQIVATVNAGGNSQVDVYLERNPISLPGFGQVTGTIISSKAYGEPLAGLIVTVVGQPISNTTNPDGEFILYTVPEGDHELEISNVLGQVYLKKYIYVEKGEIVDTGLIYLPLLPEEIP
ncbi:MAG: carboxypeptidase-like regulatory domain-containing protein [bacterium]|nr:carboxypeptidase-like regulatory domain-containing protein [bacterium]